MESLQKMGDSRMAEFTGEFLGLTYRAEWNRISAGRVSWGATVLLDTGRCCGARRGLMHDMIDATTAHCEAQVRIAVEHSIRGGVYLDHGGAD